MVELLAGIITGAGVGEGVASVYNNFDESGHNGHFVLALDVARWMPLETYFSILEQLIADIKRSNPVIEVLLPGEIRWRNLEDNAARGVALDEKLEAELRALSQPYEIAFPGHMTPDTASREPIAAAQCVDRDKLRAISA